MSDKEEACSKPARERTCGGSPDSVKRHVLVIDDDPIQLHIIKKYLEGEYTVTVIPTGKAAIEYLISNHPDVILLDYVMPLYNGPTVLKIIRSRDESRDIPIFFLTGATDKDIVIECLSYNPAGYIVKPVTKDEIIQKLGDFFMQQERVAGE